MTFTSSCVKSMFVCKCNVNFLDSCSAMLHNQTLYDRKLTVRMDRVDHKPEGPPKLPEGLRGLGMGLGAGGNPLQDVSRELSFASAVQMTGSK
jgi:hypothetical protein